MVLHQAWVRRDWAQDVDQLALRVEPIVEVIMDIMEIFHFVQKRGPSLALLLQLLPPCADLIQIVIQEFGTRRIWLLLQQVLDVDPRSVQLALVLIQLVQDTLEDLHLLVGLLLISWNRLLGIGSLLLLNEDSQGFQHV